MSKRSSLYITALVMASIDDRDRAATVEYAGGVARHCQAKTTSQVGRWRLRHQANECEHRGENTVTVGVVGHTPHAPGRASLE